MTDDTNIEDTNTGAVEDTEIKNPDVKPEPAAEDDVSDDPVGDTDDSDSSNADHAATQAKPDPAQYYANEAAQLKRQLEELKETQTKSQKDAEERERLSYMTPEERTQYQFNKERQEMRSEFESIKRQTQFMTRDATDRAEFTSKYSNTVLAKYSGEVEKAYQNFIRAGINANREDALAMILGKKAMEAGRKGVGTRQKAKGAENINKSKSQGGTVKSDTQGSKTAKQFAGNDMSMDALEARLKGKNLLSQSWGNA